LVEKCDEAALGFEGATVARHGDPRVRLMDDPSLDGMVSRDSGASIGRAVIDNYNLVERHGLIR
jgi:hypothetical protein